MSKTTEFTGFGAETIGFIEDLRFHNDRDWFKSNRARYEQAWLAPAVAFIEAMAPHLAKVAPHMTAVPKQTGGSLMRIYRDTRFSKDKTPYKTNIGIQFRHDAGKDVHAPGLYVHIEPGEHFLGCGLWRPPAKPLRAIRDRIAEQPEAWKAVIHDAAFASRWVVGGESLKRAPKDFDPEHPLIEDIKRKDFTAGIELEDADVARADFVEFAAARFKEAAPFMGFLCQAVGVAY
jgi:uncharacterized protein (TIGR02453 family)